MNIYDKTQDDFQNYKPDYRGFRHFKLTMGLVGALLVLILAVLVAWLFGRGILSQRVVTYALLAVAIFFSLYLFRFSSSNKEILNDMRAYHDFYFCPYKTNNNSTTDGLLVKMAEAKLAEGDIEQASHAISLVRENGLNQKDLARYRLTQAAIESPNSLAVFQRSFSNQIRRRVKLCKTLQGIEIFILIIAIISTIILIVLAAC